MCSLTRNSTIPLCVSLLIVGMISAGSAVAQGGNAPYVLTRHVADWTYYPGETLRVSVTVSETNPNASGSFITLYEEFPQGWTWVRLVTDSPFLSLDPGGGGVYIGIDFHTGGIDTGEDIAFPFTFEYEVAVPSTEKGLRQLVGQASLYVGEQSQPLASVVTSLVPPGGAPLDEAFIEQLQQQGEEEGWTFTVSLNPATQRTAEELAGTDESFRPPDSEIPQVTFPKVAPKALPAQYDLRTLGGNVPIRDQGGCGSCWAFALAGVAEVMIGVRDGQMRDFSEQWILSCNNSGFSCLGGWNPVGLLFGPDKCGLTGLVSESSLPYQAVVTSCPCGAARIPYPFSYVGRINDALSFTDKTNAIKQAIMTYGPVWTTVRAGYTPFFAYSGGVFNACLNDSIDHAVVLVGWDDNTAGGVWIMRNSWGAGWGNNGYMLIRYGCSLIGSFTDVINYTGSPTTGGIKVSLAPADAVTKGAGWKINGGATQASGATVNGLTAGQYTISYTPATGYTAPANEVVTVTVGNVTQLTRQYIAGGGSWVRTPINQTVYYGNCWSRSGSIRVNGASKIRVGLSNVDIESCCDRLYIGSNIVSGTSAAFVTDELNQDTIYLDMQSDGSASGSFTIAYVEHQGSTATPTVSGTIFAGSGDDCGSDCGDAKSLNGTISEPLAAAANTDPQLEIDASVSGLSRIMTIDGAKPYRLSPAGLFSTPVTLSLPLSSGVDPADVELYYYSETAGQQGWYRAVNVIGLLASDTVVPAEDALGQPCLQFQVNHGGVFQLGRRIAPQSASILPASVDVSGSWKGWATLTATCLALLAALGARLRAQRTSAS